MDMPPFDFSKFQFSPVIHLPKDYEIYDFTQGYDPHRNRRSDYGIGRYNERRPGMYATDLFVNSQEPPRDIHIGIDIAAPIGTPVHAFYEGVVLMAGINSAEGDYGGTMITEHVLDDGNSGGGKKIWALYGHLSHASVRDAKIGGPIHSGDVIAFIGDRHENGGWNPHLHFQLSWIQPDKCDLPGAVNEKDLPWALANFPDPRFVLGSLY